MVTLSLSVLKKPQISPNIWKFNNDLLKNDRSYQQVLALIEEIDKLDMSNLNKWEWFKFKVKKIAIDTGKFLSVRRKQKQREQIGEINSLVVNTQESPENSAKLQSLIAISTRWVVFRKSKWSLYSIESAMDWKGRKKFIIFFWPWKTKADKEKD